MESRKGKLRSKSQRNSQIKVVTSWQHTEEVPPAFKRLMALLLQPRENQPKETGRGEGESNEYK